MAKGNERQKAEKNYSFVATKTFSLCLILRAP